MRFHIQQESDISASTQLYNQICFAIAARHYPPGHRLPSTRQLAMQTGLHRNTISKVYRQLEIDGVVEAIAGSGIYVRDNLTKREFKKSLYSKDKISKLHFLGDFIYENCIKNSEENEGSYTPAEREQMDRLNNIETIDTESSN